MNSDFSFRIGQSTFSVGDLGRETLDLFLDEFVFQHCLALTDFRVIGLNRGQVCEADILGGSGVRAGASQVIDVAVSVPAE